ncbi:hypothetical protein Sjap_000367 [Stephania japonica]|uniref:Uncharacterized protein n=1 Tax=Stephania japonica TaxID=461633 RepID=A0AAP0PQN8_9MAGN|nr:COMT protein [Stephania japonica]
MESTEGEGIHESEHNHESLLEAQAHVYMHTFHYINSMSLKCAVELSIPDIIQNHKKPITLSQLAHALNIPESKSPHLYRLMRLLVHNGFFAKQKILNELHDQDQEGYVLKLPSKFLLKDNPSSLSSFNLTMLDQVLLRPWQFMSAWFQGTSDEVNAFETAYGKSFWDYAVEHTDLCSSFAESMAGDSRLIAEVVVREFKVVFEGLRSVVDVGGGVGVLARVIAETFPHIKCSVLELPQVVSSCQGYENLEFVAGDMFQAIPSADAVLLKWVLHDWSDEECVKILKRGREAIGSKVIIIDVVLDIKGRTYGCRDSAEMTQLMFDMQMVVDTNGKERTQNEWEKLFLEAGFTSYKIIPSFGFRSIIEVFP